MESVVVVIGLLFVKIHGTTANLKGMILLSLNWISINLIRTKQNTPISLDFFQSKSIPVVNLVSLGIWRRARPGLVAVKKKVWKTGKSISREYFAFLLRKGQPFLKNSSHIVPLRATRWSVKDFCGLENPVYSICAFYMLQITYILSFYDCFMHNKAITSQFFKHNDFPKEKMLFK